MFVLQTGAWWCGVGIGMKLVLGKFGIPRKLKIMAYVECRISPISDIEYYKPKIFIKLWKNKKANAVKT